MSRLLFILLVFQFLLFGCQNKGALPIEKTIQKKKHFQIEDSLNYKILTITNPYVGSSLTERYVLYQKGSPKPKNVTATHFVAIPINNFAINSTTHLGFLKELGKLIKSKQQRISIYITIQVFKKTSVMD